MDLWFLGCACAALQLKERWQCLLKFKNANVFKGAQLKTIHIQDKGVLDVMTSSHQHPYESPCFLFTTPFQETQIHKTIIGEKHVEKFSANGVLYDHHTFTRYNF